MNAFKKKITINNLAETKKKAEKIAQRILRVKNQKTIILALTGELGSGKTSFVQGLARGLGLKEKILSPTFVLLKKFRIKKPGFKIFYHLDCYRIESPEDLKTINLKKIINQPGNITAIEWAERITQILPPETIVITFNSIEKNKRELIVVDKKRVLF
jgi:tRNA threonylcarbamoyladenosine biosynthesis protein TsaE